MRLSTISLLALTSGNAVAARGPWRMPRAASLPLPAQTIFQLDGSVVPDSWFENLAIRQNGDLLVTMSQPYASIYAIHEPLSGSPTASIINIDNANGTIGIFETSPDVFAVAAGLYSSLAVPVPGTLALWEVDLRGSEPATRLIVNMPDAGGLNGVTGIKGNEPSTTILVADYGLALVWRVDVKTGEYEVAAKVPEMEPLPNATIPLGVNGLKTSRDGGYLYFSNSNLASIFRLAIDERGIARKGARAELVARFEADDIDDFAIDDETGDFWACTNFQDTVAVARFGSTTPGVVVAGSPADLTVAGDTALALGGRTESDKDIVYVVTGGALARPVNGTVTEPAKVVAINRRGFQDSSPSSPSCRT